MSGGYNPKVSHPWMSNEIVQMESGAEQKPFYFGGSQVPISLGLTQSSFDGSGVCLKMKPNKSIPIYRKR